LPGSNDAVGLPRVAPLVGITTCAAGRPLPLPPGARAAD
jgi:hypothetical protein